MATDWLRYANQGATRNRPLDPKLAEALGFLPELGVTMEVFSGGQPAEGPNRVGSTRHDHGRSADVFFYKDGRKLDWANEADRPLFGDIVARAKAAGVTGFGAGPGYMQPGSMHLGFGKPAVWGAEGKGANAPDWLRAAYGAAGGVPQTQTATAPQAPGTPAPAITESRAVGSAPVASVQPTASSFGDMVAPRPPSNFGTVIANWQQRKRQRDEEEEAERQRRALLLGEGIGGLYG